MSNEMAEPNNAALLDARRRATGESSKLLDSIIQGTNCEETAHEMSGASTVLTMPTNS